jgi:hypothetical protein
LAINVCAFFCVTTPLIMLVGLDSNSLIPMFSDLFLTYSIHALNPSSYVGVLLLHPTTKRLIATTKTLLLFIILSSIKRNKTWHNYIIWGDDFNSLWRLRNPFQTRGYI